MRNASEYCISNSLLFLLYGYYDDFLGISISDKSFMTKFPILRCKSRRCLEMSLRIDMTMNIRLGEN